MRYRKVDWMRVVMSGSEGMVASGISCLSCCCWSRSGSTFSLSVSLSFQFDLLYKASWNERVRTTSWTIINSPVTKRIWNVILSSKSLSQVVCKRENLISLLESSKTKVKRGVRVSDSWLREILLRSNIKWDKRVWDFCVSRDVTKHHIHILSFWWDFSFLTFCRSLVISIASWVRFLQDRVPRIIKCCRDPQYEVKDASSSHRTIITPPIKSSLIICNHHLINSC